MPVSARVPSPEELEVMEEVLTQATSCLDEVRLSLEKLREGRSFTAEAAFFCGTETPDDAPLLSFSEVGRLFLFADRAMHDADDIRGDAGAILDLVRDMATDHRPVRRKLAERVASWHQSRAEELQARAMRVKDSGEGDRA
jgi:hypothetical protein